MKRIVALIILVMLSFTIGGCSGKRLGAKQTIKYPNTPWFDVVYIADEKGYFKDEGLNVEFVGELPAGQLVPAVASGKIDFALRMTPLVITANAGGSNLKLIAAGAQSTEALPHMRYFVRKESPIAAFKEVTGKKVAINSFGACSEYVTVQNLQKLIAGAKVDFVVLPDAQQEQALIQKQVDVAIVHAPYSKKLANNPDARELITDFELDGGVTGMLPYFTRDDYAKQNPETVKGFVTAITKAGRWAKVYPEEAAQIIGKRLKIDPEDVEPWNYYPNQIVPTPEVKAWIELLEERDQIPKGKFQPEDIIDNQYNPLVAKGE